ncbi:MAG: Fic family protein [Firmicutes bacterium]|nr:Fic family protein [Bacillota bacterium]
MGYIPPFILNDEMLEAVTEIVEMLGRISNIGNLDKLPSLRRAGRIKSIHSSLAIEKNTLTIEQVTDIINGKRVLGPPNEIQEVKNAYDAYKEIETLDPISVKDLLKIHGIMMRSLVDNSGAFRTGQVGVFDSDGKVIHMAPPALNVPSLIGGLFEWLKSSKAHPLIKSSVFHYEFEFIHPFPDGNGRMGRLWQTIILSAWKPVFAWIPIESMVKERQQEYYNAIAASTSLGSSNPFIMFMLKAIADAVEGIVNDTRAHLSHISERVRKLLGVMQDYPMSANEIMDLLRMKSKPSFRANYLQPAIEAGLIGLTDPDTPTNRNQRYFKKSMI